MAEICRRLDGIPLAIEIAASRVDTFGVAGLAAGLNDRFQLLMQGRRTALPRHRTLSATLDWSYSQLSEVERLVLRRLAAFVGAFTMEAASAVLAQADTSAAAIIDAIANLVAKSLVWADVGGAVALYRLLDVTRTYALAKLEESGESDQHRARDTPNITGARSRRRRPIGRPCPPRSGCGATGILIDNVRAALEWAFSPAGDPATAVAITVGAVPLWFGLSLTSECAERVDRALTGPSCQPRRAERDAPPRHAGLVTDADAGGRARDAGCVDPRSRNIGSSRETSTISSEALWGLWAGLLNRNEFRAALEVAERFSELAKAHSRSADVLVGERMIGYIVHLMGDQPKARRHLERMLSGYVAPVTGRRDHPLRV